MPRVVQDQSHKFETDELFRKLSEDTEVCQELRRSSIISLIIYDTMYQSNPEKNTFEKYS
jgi:hypothetical protein